ncbi:MAG: PIN domain-containing protein [Chthoniobacterales bacterium]
MKYLVDANVLSEPTKPVPDARAIAWLRRHERDLAVSPIILGELEYGILILPASRRRTRLEQWFSAGIPRLRVLDFDTAAAGAWASLLAPLKKKGRALLIKDSLIAATALAQADRSHAEHRRLSPRRGGHREPLSNVTAVRIKRKKHGLETNPESVARTIWASSC